MKRNMRINDREWSKHMWERIKAMIAGEGYISAETDPTVPAWAKQPSKPSYTASEVGALPNTTTIPTKTSDLTNDSGFITAASVPTKTSDLTNDGDGSSRFATLNDIGDPNVTNATGVLPIAHGGTGAWNVLWARQNLGVCPTLTLTGSEITDVYALHNALINATPYTKETIIVSAESAVTRIFTENITSGDFVGMVVRNEIQIENGDVKHIYYFNGSVNGIYFRFGDFTITNGTSLQARVWKAESTRVMPE